MVLLNSMVFYTHTQLIGRRSFHSTFNHDKYLRLALNVGEGTHAQVHLLMTNHYSRRSDLRVDAAEEHGH